MSDSYKVMSALKCHVTFQSVVVEIPLQSHRYILDWNFSFILLIFNLVNMQILCNLDAESLVLSWYATGLCGVGTANGIVAGLFAGIWSNGFWLWNYRCISVPLMSFFVTNLFVGSYASGKYVWPRKRYEWEFSCQIYIVLLVIMALVFHFFPLRIHTVAFNNWMGHWRQFPVSLQFAF